MDAIVIFLVIGLWIWRAAAKSKNAPQKGAKGAGGAQGQTRPRPAAARTDPKKKEPLSRGGREAPPRARGIDWSAPKESPEPAAAEGESTLWREMAAAAPAAESGPFSGAAMAPAAPSDALSGAGEGEDPCHEDMLRPARPSRVAYEAAAEADFAAAAEGEDPCHPAAERPHRHPAVPEETEAAHAAFSQEDLLRAVVMSEILTRPRDRKRLRRP